MVARNNHSVASSLFLHLWLVHRGERQKRRAIFEKQKEARAGVPQRPTRGPEDAYAATSPGWEPTRATGFPPPAFPPKGVAVGKASPAVLGPPSSHAPVLVPCKRGGSHFKAERFFLFSSVVIWRASDEARESAVRK